MTKRRKKSVPEPRGAEQSNGRQCKGTTTDGERCVAPSALVVYDGFCYSHTDNPAIVQHRAAANLRGGLTTKARSKQAFAKDMAALPPLTDIAAAELWAAAIVKATLGGQLTGPASQAALRGVREFRNAHEQNKLVKRLAELEEKLRQQNSRRGR